MIIYSLGMYRSGSTLQYQIASEIIERKNLGERITWHNLENLDELKQNLDPKMLYTFKSHLINEYIMNEINTQEAKALYCFRDIRDVFTSLKIKNELSVENLLKRRLIHDSIEIFYKLRSNHNVLVSKYEDLVESLELEVKRISEYINVKLSNVELSEISKLFTIEKQIERIEIAKAKNDLISAGKHKYNSKSLLHSNHISSDKGKIGRWKDHLSNSELELIETEFKQYLIDNNYK